MKKTILYIFGLLFYLCSCNSSVKHSTTVINSANETTKMAQENLEFGYSFTRKERSKDSNGQDVIVYVKNRKIHITKKYSGRDPRKEDKKLLRISKEEEAKILNYLRLNNLDTTFTENQPTDAIGVSVFLEFEMPKPIISNISISGQTKFWGSSGKKSNIKNKQTIFDTEQLLYFIEHLK